ncbi:OmpA family protein [Aureibaculum conchae]|uniref:OmpA family protein n=1 Tax=Aureibaculum sp. 2308TA14-22 TaxID=3108392 RepID=UPI0033997973
MKKSEQNISMVSDSLNKLLFDHYYSLATEAVSKGNFSLANKYISGLTDTNGDDPILLDLRAKIYAQQGKLIEAGSLWKKCVTHDPENNKYNEALSRINKLQKTKVTWRLRLAKIIGATLTIVLILFLLVFIYQGRDEKKSKLEMLQKQQSVILERIDNSLIASENTQADSLISIVAKEIEEVDGISFEKNSMELLIKFNEGLFSNGIKFKHSQESTIKQLAKVLERYSGNTIIMILGCSDNIPLTDSIWFKSNHALGLARANYIYNTFYQNSRILTENLIFGSIGDTNTPFSNDSMENRMKNRTVVIKIIRKK